VSLLSKESFWLVEPTGFFRSSSLQFACILYLSVSQALDD
jgi:hypothetical protein